MTTISDERLAERGVEVLKRIATAKLSLEDASLISGWVHDARNALRAQGGVRVKPLEWSSEPPYSVARVTALRLFYSIEAVWDDGVFQHVELRGGFASGDFATAEAAKAAAQADYDRRILGALEASPAPVSGEMVQRLFDEMDRKMNQPKHIHQESNPDWIPVDDTQIGVEFAIEFITAALAAKGGQ